MGYQVEVHQEPVQIGNSFGRLSSNSQAHVIVRRNQFNGYGDIGFERTDKGFVLHADDYDVGSHGNRFGISSLNKKYVENKIKKYVSTKSSVNIFSRSENEKGQIEIQLRLS